MRKKGKIPRFIDWVLISAWRKSYFDCMFDTMHGRKLTLTCIVSPYRTVYGNLDTWKHVSVHFAYQIWIWTTVKPSIYCKWKLSSSFILKVTTFSRGDHIERGVRMREGVKGSLCLCPARHVCWLLWSARGHCLHENKFTVPPIPRLLVNTLTRMVWHVKQIDISLHVMSSVAFTYWILNIGF